MRIILFFLFAVSLYSCNSSSSKKDTNQIMDDTTLMDNKPIEQSVSGFTGAAIMPLSEIPSTIKVEGIASEAWKWNDSLGENILILSHVVPYDDKGKNEDEEKGQTASLHAALYKKKLDKYEYVWGLNDKERICPFDITCSFIPGSTTITDLNKNGYAEIKVQYLTACRSDVSPARMVLGMWENGVYYELRGNSWVGYDPQIKFDVNESNVNLQGTPRLKDELEEMTRRMGRYESERDFKSAPTAFLAYARSEWIKFAKEKMGE